MERGVTKSVPVKLDVSLPVGGIRQSMMSLYQSVMELGKGSFVVNLLC